MQVGRVGLRRMSLGGTPPENRGIMVGKNDKHPNFDTIGAK